MAKSMSELLEILQAQGDNVSKSNNVKRGPKIKIRGNKSKITDQKSPKMISLPGVYYIGYVKGFTIKPLAVSEDKDLVKRYMEDHRFLKPSMYYIEKVKNLSEHDITCHYFDQYLTEYEGYYIPSIDVTMIDFYRRSIRDEIYTTAKSLSQIDLICKEAESVSDEDRDAIYQSIKVLSKFLKDQNILDELDHEDMITRSILFEDIKGYIRDLANFEEMMENHRRWEYQIYKDEDDFLITWG